MDVVGMLPPFKQLFADDRHIDSAPDILLLTQCHRVLGVRFLKNIPEGDAEVPHDRLLFLFIILHC